MARLPAKAVRKKRSSDGGKARWEKYHALLAEKGISPEEMRRSNNRKRVQRFRSKLKAAA